MGWFERFGVSMVRGVNLLVFLTIVLAGFLFAVGAADNPAMGGAVIIASFLLGGLVTGMISLFCQMYDRQVEQVELLKELLKKENG